MPIEMQMLLWSVALAAVQMVIATLGTLSSVGLPTAAGNRANMPAFEGWAGRAQRAHRNMLENLVLFAPLVLIAAVQGKFNATTALGAEIFFGARLAYAVVYLVGIPWLRTAVFTVSFVGLVMIFIPLIK